MYRYMVSYIDPTDRGASNGNVEVFLPAPISDMDDVAQLTRDLRRNYGLNQPIIMGFSPFVEAGR